MARGGYFRMVIALPEEKAINGLIIAVGGGVVEIHVRSRKRAGPGRRRRVGTKRRAFRCLREGEL
ncbi:MAG: hypothetical protein N2595_06265 [bacterium]|nr:hypothetical protein [bacterium]